MSRYNPLDPKSQQAAKDEAAKVQAARGMEHADDIKWLMADVRGRRLMRNWLAAFGVDRISFTGDSKTFFKEGERNAGLRLKADITQHAMEDYFQMLREHLADSESARIGG